MGAFRVELSPRAVGDIAALDKADQKKVVRKLELLEQDARPPGVEKLKENPAFWRLWVGRNYRIIYTIHDADHLIVVALVRHRKDAYKSLANLDAAALIAALKPVFDQPRVGSSSQ